MLAQCSSSQTKKKTANACILQCTYCSQFQVGLENNIKAFHGTGLFNFVALVYVRLGHKNKRNGKLKKNLLLNFHMEFFTKPNYILKGESSRNNECFEKNSKFVDFQSTNRIHKLISMVLLLFIL